MIFIDVKGKPLDAKTIPSVTYTHHLRKFL